MSFQRILRFTSLFLLGSAALVVSQLHSEEGPLVHAERSFVIHLDAAPNEVFPLFDPGGEREWAPGWDPKMVFPADGSSPRKDQSSPPATRMAKKSGLSPGMTRKTVSSVMWRCCRAWLSRRSRFACKSRAGTKALSM
jgi:hypothetical protein